VLVDASVILDVAADDPHWSAIDARNGAAKNPRSPRPHRPTSDPYLTFAARSPIIRRHCLTSVASIESS
jgi:hypothetical protein